MTALIGPSLSRARSKGCDRDNACGGRQYGKLASAVKAGESGKNEIEMKVLTSLSPLGKGQSMSNSEVSLSLASVVRAP